VEIISVKIAVTSSKLSSRAKTKLEKLAKYVTERFFFTKQYITCTKIS